MSVVISAVPKKKSSHPVHLSPRDGHTGMGSKTKRHFADVRNKMVHYVAEQEALNYEVDLQARPFSHTEKLRHRVKEIFTDGTPSPKSHTKSSTPTPSRKNPGHHDFKTPQLHHRDRKQSSKHQAK